MRWTKKKNRIAMAVTAALAGGTVLQSNCANALYSLPICGGVLTFCTPSDQLNFLFPLLQTPDFRADPSCSIPLGCGDDDIYNIPDGYAGPGGDGANQPTDDQSGGASGGTGGGGGI